jgi:sulfatase modifying factor 1
MRWQIGVAVLMASGVCGSAAAEHDKVLANSIGVKLVLIPAGEFMMGSGEPAHDTVAYFNRTYGIDWTADRYRKEHPQHRVRISHPYYFGIYHVTRGQFRQFVEATDYKTDAENPDKKGAMGVNTESGKPEFKEAYCWRNVGYPWQTDEHPVVNVSWNDAIAFCEWLSRKERQTYRLPTEAEWEYACRAGTTTRYWCGDDAEGLARVANVSDATAKAKYPRLDYTINGTDGYVFTAPVGSFRANAFGLHDMHGNAWQWCADWYGGEYYSVSSADDPVGPKSGECRVLRGGSWSDSPDMMRSAQRNWGEPDRRNINAGFRVARSLQSPLPSGTTQSQQDKARVGGPILEAAKAGDVSAVTKLLDSDPKLVNAVDRDGWSPLYLASGAGHRDVAELLIARGASVNAANNVGRATPLHAAAGLGQMDTARLLCAKGADTNARGMNGVTPLVMAAMQGHSEMVKLLLAHHADIDAKTDAGATALYMAALQGRTQVARVQIQNGAGVNATDKKRQTPLHCAAAKGDRGMIELLVESGADTAATSALGMTPIEVATRAGHTGIADLMRGGKRAPPN